MAKGWQIDSILLAECIRNDSGLQSLCHRSAAVLQPDCSIFTSGALCLADGCSADLFFIVLFCGVIPRKGWGGLPLRPVAGEEDPGGEEEIGGGVGDDSVAETAFPLHDAGVGQTSEDADKPLFAMHEAEGNR